MKIWLYRGVAMAAIAAWLTTASADNGVTDIPGLTGCHRVGPKTSDDPVLSTIIECGQYGGSAPPHPHHPALFADAPHRVDPAQQTQARQMQVAAAALALAVDSHNETERAKAIRDIAEILEKMKRRQ